MLLHALHLPVSAASTPPAASTASAIKSANAFTAPRLLHCCMMLFRIRLNYCVMKCGVHYILVARIPSAEVAVSLPRQCSYAAGDCLKCDIDCSSVFVASHYMQLDCSQVKIANRLGVTRSWCITPRPISPSISVKSRLDVLMCPIVCNSSS